MTLHSNLPKLKIAILGASQTGKSAVVVRYLTRRFISEYCSQIDFLYRHSMYLDATFQIEVDILDTSGTLSSEDLLEHLEWANAYVVVYAISDQGSFHYACQLLESISVLKASQGCPFVLLANKGDLSEVARQITAKSGESVAARYSCPFYEVSAAENFHEIIRAFRCLIQNSKSLLVEQISASSSSSTTSSQASPSLKVSRMFGLMLAKMGKKGAKRKQKSLSI